jgi:hypothetical protein
MGKIIEFPAERARARTAAGEAASENGAELLFFTGIRYSRPEQDSVPDADKTALQKQGNAEAWR